MANNMLIRSALLSEQKQLEALQLRASLSNEGDRDALLANPDAIVNNFRDRLLEQSNERVVQGRPCIYS
jgi:hypothetical protein